jgi:serine/threonine-protein phosphatase 2A regulatory subunit A
MVNHESSNVRAAIALHITSLAPILGQDNTNTYLVDFVLNLLKDEQYDVKLNLIGTLHKITQVIGVTILSQKLLSAIIQLTEDKQWRVRMSMIEYLPYLANILGLDYFNEKLINIALSSLVDPVHSIRIVSMHNLFKLTQEFGVNWFATHIIPEVSKNSGHSNYTIRASYLQTLSILSEILSEEHLLPLLTNIEKMVEDPVPNVRLHVAKALGSFKRRLNSQELSTRISTSLQKMSTDADKDVRDNANKGMN